MSKILLHKRVRVTETMDAKDSGRWVTTEEGHHIHLDKNGKPDKGNPKVIKAMKSGKPKCGGGKKPVSKTAKETKKVVKTTKAAPKSKTAAPKPKSKSGELAVPKLPSGVKGIKEITSIVKAINAANKKTDKERTYELKRIKNRIDENYPYFCNSIKDKAKKEKMKSILNGLIKACKTTSSLKTDVLYD